MIIVAIDSIDEVDKIEMPIIISKLASNNCICTKYSRLYI